MASGFIKRKMEGWHLLWELPAGTTELPSQTLNINLTNYDAIKVKMRVYPGAENSSHTTSNATLIQTYYVPVYDEGHSIYGLIPNNTIFSNDAFLYLYGRTIRARSSAGIVIGDGLGCTASNSSATPVVQTNRMIPYKIWGQRKIL